MVLTPEQTVDDGQRIADSLMARLGIEARHLVRDAYVDLIARLPPDAHETGDRG